MKKPDVNTLAGKYVTIVEEALRTLRMTEPPSDAASRRGELLDLTHRYLSDAKYYFSQEQFSTSLSCASYAEGLLDALRILGLVQFEWSRPV